LPPTPGDLVALNPQPLPPSPGDLVGLNPQPLPPTPGDLVALNPQPLPPSPGDLVGLNPQPLPPKVGGWSWMESFSWGAASARAIGGTGGHEFGQVNMHEFTITRPAGSNLTITMPIGSSATLQTGTLAPRTWCTK